MKIRLFKSIVTSLILAFSGVANAGLIIGNTNSGGNWFPFGGGGDSANWGPTYQMVLDSTLFTSSINIETLRFYRTIGATTPGPGTYTISLSTTDKSSSTLTANSNNNLGANNTMVFQGVLGSLNGNFLDIVLSSSFFYDMTQGNLLMTVTNVGGSSSGLSGFASNDGGGGARFYRDTVTTSDWLTTGINQFSSASSIPEPATYTIMLISLGALAARRRKSTK